MADLRAEQILNAVLAIVETTTTAGGDVVRDRDAPAESESSISIEQGGDTPVDLQSNTVVDSVLDISIVATVIKNDTYSTQINLIRKEVYVAMMADRELGLPDFVSDTWQVNTEKPEAFEEGGTTVMKMPINFQVSYQHSLTDASE